MKLKLKVNRKPKTTRIRFDVNKLTNGKTADNYKDELEKQLKELDIHKYDLTTSYKKIEDISIDSATRTIGKYRRKKQPWITNDILDLCDERRSLKAAKNKNNIELISKYRKVNNKIRKDMKTAKDQWIQMQCKSINEDMKYGRHNKRAYETLKSLTRTPSRSTSIIEDKNGQPLAEENSILKRWTEYCQELYNYPIKSDHSIIISQNTDNVDELPILKSKVEDSIQKLKEGKSLGIDNIPGELLKYGGDAIVNVFTELCQLSWSNKEWPKQWIESLIVPILKKGNLRKCENYITLSLICHSSKILLRIILNRLTSQAEEVLSEEQSGFRKGRSTTEQIFNCRNLIEKHLESQKDLYHNFIDFKKAFDRVWHEGLWSTLNKYGIDYNITLMIKSLYKNSTSAMLFNSIQGQMSKITVGVRQGCLLSPVLFNLFLEEIMAGIQDEHISTISIGGRNLSNLRFADDIDLIAGSNDELQTLTNKLSSSASRYGMQISAEKSKIMINSNKRNLHSNIKLYGEKLEEVEQFK